MLDSFPESVRCCAPNPVGTLPFNRSVRPFHKENLIFFLILEILFLIAPARLKCSTCFMVSQSCWLVFLPSSRLFDERFPCLFRSELFRVILQFK